MPIQAASTVVLMDDSGGAAPRLFLVRRHAKSVFMPNFHVFPGGRIDPEDAAESWQEYLAGSADGRLDGADGPGATALVIGGIRETFEEAGVLLASAGPASVVAGPDWPRLRDDLNAGRRTFAEIITGLAHATPSLQLGRELIYFDRWVTPPGGTRRFDARFFIALMPKDQRAIHDAHETTASCWLTAAEAIALHKKGELGLAPPTWCALQNMASLGGVDAILRWARGRAVQRILPELDSAGGRFVGTAPGDPLDRGTGGVRLTYNGTYWRAD